MQGRPSLYELHREVLANRESRGYPIPEFAETRWLPEQGQPDRGCHVWQVVQGRDLLYLTTCHPKAPCALLRGREPRAGTRGRGGMERGADRRTGAFSGLQAPRGQPP